MHKDNPLRLTSGHPRWSIHSMNHTSRLMLGTHRGYPVMYMNPDDMAARGLENDGEAEVWNDLASIRIRVRRSPGTMPGQVVIYNGYEPFQYRGIHWQPIPIDRAVHVDARKA